ncbi:MAG: hypothetical protein HRT77_11235 [Halioglobus sp.]|nr:hypothetical protein [Halioglobus sp.]
MDHRDNELNKAWEELTFWREFAAWQKGATGALQQPRVHQALALAEARYRHARLRQAAAPVVEETYRQHSASAD